MVGKSLAFIGAYMRANLATALEYRVSLVSQVVGMLINNALWVFFWALYFSRFSVVRGWTLDDVVMLWAVVTTSFGLAVGLMGNVLRIPQLIAEGQLDFYLALPKNPLLHLLVSRMAIVNLGDLLFGPVLLALVVRPGAATALVYLVVTVLSALVLLGFLILIGSLAFFIGHAEAVLGQVANALVHFSTYPATLFDRRVQTILYTVLPAGLISTLPVELVREFDWIRLLWLAGAAAAFLGLGVWTFHRGLRRYESGNLMVMRS
ncbi:ABC-2 type transport system permease protein [Symbiobacterium terraclitae]|uniref:ABC-2 type transport system permease protein n=1 Tax=Symbiobacterium terraclitae TaxID=557451 RepID=A0ABS4JQA9_9FIRM|nr:ABC-2 family transporter protein [Symbiobacterium terraclitae]MBP2017166.1 ABC-2 type transport system permease protein [Symbiobacterium terraclitae]